MMLISDDLSILLYFSILWVVIVGRFYVSRIGIDENLSLRVKKVGRFTLIKSRKF